MTAPEMGPADTFAEPDEKLYDDVDRQADAAAAAEYDDFDQFWQARNAARPAKIRGLVVTPPIDVPLSLLDQVDRVSGSTDLDAIREVLAGVYGEDVVTKWTTAGMGLREFQVVLAWSGAHMRGQRVSFEQAVELVTEAMDAIEAQGKAGSNRRERRDRKRKRGAAGPTSSPAAGG